jgi:hypothetical protein
VDRGFGLARVRARHQQPAEGMGAARADQLLNPPAEYVPRPNAQLDAAGLANVQRNLHHLELLRQQHDERMGNVPVAPPGVQNPPPRRHGPQYFGWE